MSELFIKVNEVLGRENIINVSYVERITSDGNTGSILWFGPNDADSMRVSESFETVELMIHLNDKVKGVIDAENLERFLNTPAGSAF